MIMERGHHEIFFLPSASKCLACGRVFIHAINSVILTGPLGRKNYILLNYPMRIKLVYFRFHLVVTLDQ